MNIKMQHALKLGALLALAILLLAVVPTPAAAQSGPATVTCTPSCDLYAGAGTLTLPNGAGTVPIWGYATTPTGAVSSPGPTLIVNEGDTVAITLHNNLTDDTALYFQGMPLPPDMVGAPPGGTKAYTFTAAAAGTYLYQAGLTAHGRNQTAMGMFGVLIVRPLTAGQAYSDPASAYDDEAVIVLSEVDPALNNDPDPMNFDLRNYAPKYQMINGSAFPDTVDIPTTAGSRVLLRYANAGLQHHTMGLLGLDQLLLASDGSPFPASRSVVAKTIAAGETLDAIATVPLTAPGDARYALYDTNLLLHNSGQAGFGGMLTFLAIGPGTPGTGDTVGPTTSALALTPATVDGLAGGNVAVAATVDDTASGGNNIMAAEYFIDVTGVDGTGQAMAPSDTAFDSPTEAVDGVIPAATLAGLTSGAHTIYVHGQDAAGNWGSFNLSVLTVDNDGPTTSALGLGTNPTDGSVDVAVTGTADDTAAGGSNIVAAEYFIDASGADGSGQPMAVNATAPVASVDAAIPTATIAGLTEGVHAIYVHSQDAFGHWGPFAQIDLSVDRTGPTTANVTAAPNPNNGAQGINPSQPSVRVDALITENILPRVAVGASLPPEEQSQVFLPLITMGSSLKDLGMVETAAVTPGVPYVKTAEGFIDTIGADGTGFPFTPADGLFDSDVEAAYAFIPLTTINTLADGAHTIYVHGQDGVGNWGPTSSVVLVIDRTAPTVTGVSVAPDPTNGAATVTLTAIASDADTTVAAAEWFTGADPGPGNGTPMTASDGTFDSGNEGVTATIDLTGFTAGAHTISVRALDAAGNWSAVTNGTFTVSNPPPSLLDALYFSTQGNVTVPGVAGRNDNADIYTWDGATTFTRLFDGSVAGLPGNANIDGLAMVSINQFYLSFARNGGTNVPGVGTVQDEDVVFYDNGTWSLFFDGSVAGLPGTNEADIDALDVVGGVLYFSTTGRPAIPGVAGPYDDADVYTWDGTSFGKAFDGRNNGLPGNADFNGLDVAGPNDFYFTFNRNTGVNVPGVGTVQDESVVRFNGTWSLYFDGTAQGLNASNGQDVDAISVP